MYRRLLRDYLSLTRGERRGMQILCTGIIILLVFRASIPLLVPDSVIDLSEAEKQFIAFQDSILAEHTNPSEYTIPAEHTLSSEYTIPVGKTMPAHSRIPAERFPFDPNTASMEELVRLGIPRWTARTLINYRDAGGEFRRDSDLLRVYGLEPEVYSELEKFIRIDTAEFGPGERISVFRDREYSGDRAGKFGDKTGNPEILELNHADSLQLLSVYGIGPVFAHRIIRYREMLGGFYSPGQLMEVYGFSDSQFLAISQCSYLDTSLLRKLDLNQADAGDLAVHPYLDRYQAQSIIYCRERLGSYKSADELMDKRLLPDSVFKRIRPYLYAGRKNPLPLRD